MKFFFKNIIFFFIFISVSEANNNVKFIDINFIVNNSISGKNLNEIIEKKNKKVVSELNKIRDKLKIKKDKIVAQKNVLKKDELENILKQYEKEVKDFNAIKKKKTDEFNSFSINSKKKIIDLLNPLIANYLEKESIQILLQKDKIIFGNDKLNITKVILELFDDKYKKIKFE